MDKQEMDNTNHDETPVEEKPAMEPDDAELTATKSTNGAASPNMVVDDVESSLRSDDAEAIRKATEILVELKGDLSYSIEETPAWYTSVLLGFQHYLTMVGATIAVPLILAESLCISNDYVALAEVIGTIFFVSGIATLLQTFLGNRLPIVQGATFSFLAPTFAILALKNETTPCLAPIPDGANITAEEKANRTEIWQIRMREIQGDIMVASLFQVVIGFTGAIGLLLRFIGPLAIAPTIALIGLSLFGAAANFAGSHWGIAALTIFLITFFSQYIAHCGLPFCTFSRSKGCHVEKYFFFRLFPVILAILITWAFTFALTATDVFPTNSTEYGYGARTDIRIRVIQEASWFRFPYPGQWGLPTVSVAGVFGMLAGVLSSMIESVGDYYACARLSGAPPPPTHAVNRGIGMEGISCVIAGAIGSGNGTTSYSENIGAIGITKVGSRRVIQVGGAIMILLGCLTKFGALFVLIPDPIVGGMFMVMFGMVAAVGISNLQFVDLNSSRNLFILGFAIFSGLCIPSWVSSNTQYIKTGVPEIDQIIVVLLTTSMFVGGFFGFLLDNTIPGTVEERGIVKWQKLAGGEDGEVDSKVARIVNQCYDLPYFLGWINRINCSSYLPFCPTFKGYCRCCKRKSPSKYADPVRTGYVNSATASTHF